MAENQHVAGVCGGADHIACNGSNPRMIKVPDFFPGKSGEKFREDFSRKFCRFFSCGFIKPAIAPSVFIAHEM